VESGKDDQEKSPGWGGKNAGPGHKKNAEQHSEKKRGETLKNKKKSEEPQNRGLDDR